MLQVNELDLSLIEFNFKGTGWEKRNKVLCMISINPCDCPVSVLNYCNPETTREYFVSWRLMSSVNMKVF